MSECGFEHDDGAYVLGALSPADRAAFERHLPGCASCQESVRQLAGLPGLLSRVPVALLEGAPTTPVPDTLLPRLVRQARRTQRRRTVAIAGIAAAALTAVSFGTAVVVHHNDQSSPSASAQRFQAVGAQALSGWVSLTPVSWGTRLDLTCAYADGGAYGDPGGIYWMVVTHADGTKERVTSWQALPGKTVHLSAGTAASPSQISEISIADSAGRTVLKLHTS